MARNNKLKSKIIEKPKLISGIFEEELLNLIDSRITNNEEKINKSDLKEIAKILLPDIDILISMKIKKHLEFLGEKLIASTK